VAQRALDVLRSQGDRALQAKALHTVARSRYLLADLDDAIKNYEAALSIRRDLHDVAGEAETRAYLASAYYARGDQMRALEEYGEAARLAESVEQAGLAAYAVNGLGNVYGSRGDPVAAATAYERALTLWREGGDTGGQGIAFNNLGVLHEALGDTQMAIRMYREAFPRLRDANEPRRAAAALHNLGALNNGLGRPEQAVSFLRQALELERATGDRRSEAQTRLSLAETGLQRGALLSASREFDRSLALTRAIGDRQAEGDALRGRGEFFAASGRHRQALVSFDQARALHHTIGDVRGEARDLHATGHSLRALRRSAEALSAYDNALTMRVAAGDRSGEAATRHEMARALADQGRLDEARLAMERSLALVESIRSGLSVQDVRLAYFATVQDYYRWYVDLLMRLHERDTSAGFDRQAFDVLARARARGLLDLLSEAGADISADLPPALVARHRDVRHRISFLERERVERPAPALARREALERQMGDLVDEAEALEAEMKEGSPTYASLTRLSPLSIAQTQDLLDVDTTLLVYGIGEARTYAWVITRESIATFDLADHARVAQLALAAARAFEATRVGAALASGATGRRVADGAALSSLSDLILRPIGAALTTSRIAIVADGPLEYVPVGALPAPDTMPPHANFNLRDGAAGETPWPKIPEVSSAYRPLVAEREVVYLPSASTLEALRTEAARVPRNDGTISIFADPVFALDDARVSRASPTRASPPALPRLPATRREAEAIEAVAGPSATLLLDFNATRAAALNLSTTRSRVIHFATHAIIDDRYPELGGIHLSQVTSEGRPQEGLLHLQDVYALRLHAQLVVLSACRTAIGKEVRGEGLVGLVRGFMAAGAQRVVASLWSVDDAATAELMSAFYTALLRDGLPAGAALRRAQRHVWQQPRWNAPFYWAAFVLQGDWR
jgi:tetratricopeptide (TPR) repeat protein